MTDNTWTQRAGMTSDTDTDNVETYAEQAEASKIAAAASETAAAGSASSASTSAATATAKAAESASSATQSASSATASAASATQSASSATASAGSATTAGAAQTAAETAKAGAETAQTAAETAQAAAETAETNAETAEANAAASETAAATSAAAASGSASAAATSAAASSTSATASETSKVAAVAAQAAAETAETNAAASETAASTSATAAASSAAASAASATQSAASATAASGSATAASSSELTAASEAAAAAASATSASASETAASTAQTAAETAQAAAETAETNAETAQAAAETAKTGAEAAEANAATSATAASGSAAAAATSATAASGSAAAAAGSASAASTSASDAATALDEFTDLYLGTKGSDPTLDNDGNALQTGALYHNNSDDLIKFYNGSAWVAAYATLSGALISTNNLSDVASVSAARTNLGLGTAQSPSFNNVTVQQDPTTSLQLATKQYVDTIAAAGLHYHAPVRVEAPSALTVTYNNGSSGVGATLTNAGTQAALVIDGITLQAADRVLIYTQADATQNGVYTVTNVGSASTNWVMTRSTDTDSYAPSDPDSFGEGDAFFVKEGNTGAGELYVMNTSGAITFGTTNITFTQVASTAVYTADGGLDLTGTVFSHADTSSQATVNNSGGTVIQDVTLDTYGHVTGLTSHALTASDVGAATSAQGALADSAVQLNDTPTFGTTTVNGNVVVSGTVDGRDVAADGSKLDGIEAGAKDDQTITAGSGLSGGGTGNVTLSHADTSSVSSSDNSGNTFIQDLTFDTYGHVTAVGTGSVSVGNGTLTVQGTGALGGSGTFTANQSSNATISISHDDTSSQGSVNNSGATVIQDVTLDGYGHVTALGSHTLTLANLGYTGATNANYITNNNQLTNGAGYITSSGSITGNAGSVDGYSVSTTRNAANTIPVRNSSGYLDLGWINTTSGDTSSSLSRVYVDTGDNYIRKCTLAHLASQGGFAGDITNVSAGTNLTGGGSSGSVTLNVTASPTFTTVTATTFNTTSDRNTKTDIEPISDALGKVQQLGGYSFTFKDSGEKSSGVIAQEVQAVLPELVQEGGEGHLTVQYGNMVGLLIEAIKEQQSQIDALTAKLNG